MSDEQLTQEQPEQLREKRFRELRKAYFVGHFFIVALFLYSSYRLVHTQDPILIRMGWEALVFAVAYIGVFSMLSAGIVRHSSWAAILSILVAAFAISVTYLQLILRPPEDLARSVANAGVSFMVTGLSLVLIIIAVRALFARGPAGGSRSQEAAAWRCLLGAALIAAAVLAWGQIPTVEDNRQWTRIGGRGLRFTSILPGKISSTSNFSRSQWTGSEVTLQFTIIAGRFRAGPEEDAEHARTAGLTFAAQEFDGDLAGVTAFELGGRAATYAVISIAENFDTTEGVCAYVNGVTVIIVFHYRTGEGKAARDLLLDNFQWK